MNESDTAETIRPVCIDVTNQFRCVCCGSPQTWINAYQIMIVAGDSQRLVTPICKECFDFLLSKQ